jgi:hypothetical protein
MEPSPTGVYLADFQKKKAIQVAYFLDKNGMMLYKRTPFSRASFRQLSLKCSATG